MLLMKRIRSTLYMETHRVRKDRRTVFECNSEGFLYSGGKYPTKIKPEDLPDWFVHGHINKSVGYIALFSSIAFTTSIMTRLSSSVYKVGLLHTP